MKLLAFVLPLVLLPTSAMSQEIDKNRLNELENKVNILTREIEKIKLGDVTETVIGEAYPGFAPAASKVYRTKANQVSIGGYGEFVLTAPSRRKQNGDESGQKKRADLQRAVIYAGYKFNDWILFNSEIEFEHGGTGEGSENRGEITIEQAYLDFKFRDEIGARVGNVIVPLGLVNEVHEPTTFHGVNRPSVERHIIPSTWHENGAGLFGTIGPVNYRTYLLAGLTAKATTNPTTDGFTAASALRGGRTGGSNTSIEDIAWASRVDISPVIGTKLGTGLYLAHAGQGDVSSKVPVTLWETHAETEWRGASLKALYAEGRIGNADRVNIVQGNTNLAQNSIGRRFFGGYVEAAFDVLSLIPRAKNHALSPFFRYERYDTQAQTPSAFAKNPANSRIEYTLGVTYKPITQVAVKLDQQWKFNQARTGVNQWNFGLAYIF
jgi:hypothetical protein